MLLAGISRLPAWIKRLSSKEDEEDLMIAAPALVVTRRSGRGVPQLTGEDRKMISNGGRPRRETATPCAPPKKEEVDYTENDCWNCTELKYGKIFTNQLFLKKLVYKKLQNEGYHFDEYFFTKNVLQPAAWVLNFRYYQV